MGARVRHPLCGFPLKSSRECSPRGSETGAFFFLTRCSEWMDLTTTDKWHRDTPFRIPKAKKSPFFRALELSGDYRTLETTSLMGCRAIIRPRLCARSFVAQRKKAAIKKALRWIFLVPRCNRHRADRVGEAERNVHLYVVEAFDSVESCKRRKLGSIINFTVGINNIFDVIS